MQRCSRSIGLVMAVLLLGSCNSTQGSSSGSIETYKNQRFGFESIYPDTWRSTPPPSNLDGQTFYHPQNPDIQISVWAGYRVSPPPTVRDAMPQEDRPPSSENFTTRQGLNGDLTVEIGTQTSTINLTLMADNISYHFEGRSPSSSFADYYRLFYNVASQYQIEER